MAYWASFFRQSTRFNRFGALCGGGWCEGVVLYGSRKSFGSFVLRVFSTRNACFARDQPSPKQVGVVDMAESCQNYVRGVALNREPPRCSRRSRCWQLTSIPRAATIVRYTLLAGEAREAAAVIATKPAPALLYDTAVCYLVWVCLEVG